MESFLKTGKVGSAPAGSSGSVGKAGGSKGESAKSVPWVEKYRPKSIDDVAHQEEVVRVLRKSLDGSDLPNLLFYGPPGTGKTSTILAAARDLFGPIFKERILELNASDERGIQVVRDKVKTFAQQTAAGRRPDGVACPPYKIIILDEADSMTKDAQSALRRTMEKTGKSTKFCLICNYVSRIIEPITSRCSKFRFKPLSSVTLQARLELIMTAEGVGVSEEGMAAILETSGGDLRKAITSLQSCARLRQGQEIGPEDVYELTGVIPTRFIEGLLEVAQLNSYDRLQLKVEDLICEGFSGHQLISQLHEHCVGNACLSDSQKSQICEKLAVAEHCLLEGADEYLQVMAVSTLMMQALARG